MTYTITLLEQIEDIAAEYSSEYVWGVRFDSPGLPIGHVFPPSRVWDNGDPTGDVLPGTCAVHADHLDVLIDYVGSAYIVCGNFVAHGQDRGEVIMSDCEIMAIVD